MYDVRKGKGDRKRDGEIEQMKERKPLCVLCQQILYIIDTIYFHEAAVIN